MSSTHSQGSPQHQETHHTKQCCEQKKLHKGFVIPITQPHHSKFFYKKYFLSVLLFFFFFTFFSVSVGQSYLHNKGITFTQKHESTLRTSISHTVGPENFVATHTKKVLKLETNLQVFTIETVWSRYEQNKNSPVTKPDQPLLSIVALRLPTFPTTLSNCDELTIISRNWLIHSLSSDDLDTTALDVPASSFVGFFGDRLLDIDCKHGLHVNQRKCRH